MFMGMLEEADKDHLLALKFEPSNDEAKKELYKLKQMIRLDKKKLLLIFRLSWRLASRPY